MTTQYPRTSIGHVLHYLREWGVPETTAGRVTVGNGKISDGNKLFALYRYFDGIEQPLFMFMDTAFKNQIVEIQADGSLKAKFRLCLGAHMSPSLVVEGHQATRELYEFLQRKCFTQYIDEPGYQLTQRSGAFFQGGSHDADGKWFYVEFWRPEGAQAFVDFVNENYKPPV